MIRSNEMPTVRPSCSKRYQADRDQRAEMEEAEWLHDDIPGEWLQIEREHRSVWSIAKSIHWIDWICWPLAGGLAIFGLALGLKGVF